MKAGAEPVPRVRLCVPQELPRIIYCGLVSLTESHSQATDFAYPESLLC
jgi:hypothetical protein